MREGGQYVDSGGNAYEMQQQQHRISDQRIENEKSSYGPPLKGEGQWRWDRDGSSHMFNQGQGGDASRTYYQSQGQRSDQRLIASKKQGIDIRSQPHEEDMEVGYEDNFVGHTFESFEQKFYDDIFKLTKEQNDAEDAENTRNRERVNAIGAQYEEQLGALRARHANQRDEFLRRESHARQQQYHQAMEQQQYANSSGMPGFTDHHHHHAYNVDSYRDRPRFTRDPGFEPRGGGGQYPPPPPGGRLYGTASRYY